MNKISLMEVEATMLDNKIDQNKVQAVIKQLEQVIEELKLEKEQNSVPKSKYEYIILLNDPEGYLKDKEIAGWIVQQEENADAGFIISKLQDAAKNQNETAKRKKIVMRNLVDIFEYLKPKFLKEKKLKIKTKDLTRVIITKGEF